MGGGSGNAWLKDHDKILEHARGLHYDHVPGVTLPSAVDPDNFTEEDKQKWISSMDAFNAWKAKEVPKEASGQAWWQTYKGDSGGGDTKPTPTPTPTPESPIEEAAESNIYFPMLVPEYSAPQALDYSAYTSMSPFGGDGGLLYQPGTQQYREAYPIADNILSYQPPEIGFPQVTYSNPLNLGLLDLGGEGGGSNGKKSGTKGNNYSQNRSGKAVTSGPLSGLGHWSGNEFNDIYGNTWDGTDFSTDAELASMVSFGHPNAEIAFANWGGWNPETTTIADFFSPIADFFSPSTTSGVLGVSGGQETSSGQVGGGQVSGNPADAGYSGNY